MGTQIHTIKIINEQKLIFCFVSNTQTHSHIGLRGVKRELLLALTKCQRVKACQEVLEEYEIGKLDVNGIDYDQVKSQMNMIKIDVPIGGVEFMRFVRL